MPRPPTQHLQPGRTRLLSRSRWLALWPLLFGMTFVSLPLSAHATTYSSPAQWMAFVLTRAIDQYLGEGHAPSALTPQALDRWLPPLEQSAGIDQSSVWERFILLPSDKIIDPVFGHRMLAITTHEVAERPRTRTGRYVIWLNDKHDPPAWESRVWSAWLSEEDAVALFADHGLPLPHHGLWTQPYSRFHYVNFAIIVLSALTIWALSRLVGSWWWRRNNPRLQSVSHRQSHRSLIAILEHARVFLTGPDVVNVQESIHHGEFGLALELICTRLQEHEVSVPVSLLSLIQHAGAKMQMPESTWGGLTVAGAKNGMTT